MQRYLIFGMAVMILGLAGSYLYVSRPSELPSENQTRTLRPAAPEGMKYYQHLAYNFTLLIPEEMEVNTHRERGR